MKLSRELAVQCLEELLSADRILYGLEGETRTLRDRQVLDLLGSSSFDGLLGKAERTEVALANNRLLEAQAIVRRAVQNAGLVTDAGAIAELDAISIWDWAADGSLLSAVFDFGALRTHGRNQDRVQQTRLVVRSLVDAVLARCPGPALRVQLPPLDSPPTPFRRMLVAWVGAEPELWTAFHWLRAGLPVLVIFGVVMAVFGSCLGSLFP
ncbi:MAG: hypothetical protein ABIJ09_23220 [Pseudomonadota bacterium]